VGQRLRSKRATDRQRDGLGGGGEGIVGEDIDTERGGERPRLEREREVRKGRE